MLFCFIINLRQLIIWHTHVGIHINLPICTYLHRSENCTTTKVTSDQCGRTESFICFLVYLNRKLFFLRQNIIAGMDFRTELINKFNLYMRIGLRTRWKWPYKIRNEFVSLPGVQFLSLLLKELIIYFLVLAVTSFLFWDIIYISSNPPF